MDRYTAIENFIATYQEWIAVEKTQTTTAHIIRILPNRLKNQPTVEVYIDLDNTYCVLNAGIGFHVDDTSWTGFPISNVLNALAQGLLAENIRLFNGKVVGVRGSLTVEGEAAPIYSNRTFSVVGELLHLLKRETKTLKYEPFKRELT